MRKLHCNGCGISEPINSSKHMILPVTFAITEDSRSWMIDPEYTADLCNDCTSRLLHNYFGISAEGKLESPAFIEPRSLRVAK